MHKLHPFSKIQPIKSFDYFIQNSVVNPGHKIALDHGQVDMKREVIVFSFKVPRVSESVHLC